MTERLTLSLCHTDSEMSGYPVVQSKAQRGHSEVESTTIKPNTLPGPHPRSRPPLGLRTRRRACPTASVSGKGQLLCSRYDCLPRRPAIHMPMGTMALSFS